MSWTASVLATLAIQGVPPPAPALAPAGKWIIQYNEGDCTMSRSFGAATAPVTFAFQPSPTGALGEVLLLMPASGREDVRRGATSVTLRPSGARFDVRFVVAPLGEGRRGGRFAVGQEFWEALPTTTSLTMELENERPFSIALGSMIKPLVAARACSDDLLRTWGADPGAIARFRSGWRPGRPLWTDLYPDEAIRAREQGRAVALLTIDRRGLPTDCRVVSSAKSAALDKATCQYLMRYDRFYPAVPGEAERRFSVLPVRWSLPG